MFMLARVAKKSRAKGEKYMPGTRTAPDVEGSETYVAVSAKFVDADNGETTITMRVSASATVAQIQAMLQALQAISNASMYEAALSYVFAGAKSKANALADDYVSVKDVIRLSAKDITTGAYERFYTPAPLGDLIGDNAVVDTADTDYITWRSAVNTILPTGFTLLNVAFVQNVARNKGQSPIA